MQKQTEVFTDGLEKSNLGLTGQDIKQLQVPEEPLLTAQDGSEIELTDLEEIYENLLQDLKQRTEFPKYSTGLTKLDRTLWGLHKQELMVIGGRTSTGKSMMAIHLTRELIEQNQKVIYFSLEMNKRQLLERLLSNVCLIDGEQLRQGKALKEVEEKSKTFTDWMMDAQLLIDDRYGYRFDNILKICNYIKPDFIIIDYVQLISTKGFKDKLSALEDFVKSLHNLAINDNFGVILISQINRSGVGEPTMDKLKGAGVLEEVPDTVMLLSWNWVTNKYNCIIDKQRHGKCSNIEVIFEPQFSRFKDTEMDEIMNEVNQQRKDLV